VFGMLHGIAVLVYLGAALRAAAVLRWPTKAILIAGIAAIPPLATIPAERWLARNGHLSAPETEVAPAT